MVVFNGTTGKYSFRYDSKFNFETIGKLAFTDFLGRRFGNVDITEFTVETTIPNQPDAMYVVNDTVYECEFKSAYCETSSNTGTYSFTSKQLSHITPKNRAYVFISKGKTSINWIVIAKFDIQEALKADVLQRGRGKNDKRLRPKAEFLDGVISKNGNRFEFTRLAIYMKADIDKLISEYKTMGLNQGVL